MVCNPLYVFIIPSTGILGTSEDDYSLVTVKKIEPTAEHMESASNIAFFSNGKLGTLHGGLLHLPDYRQVMSAKDIEQLQIQQVDTELARKRQGIKHWCINTNAAPFAIWFPLTWKFRGCCTCGAVIPLSWWWGQTCG